MDTLYIVRMTEDTQSMQSTSKPVKYFPFDLMSWDIHFGALLCLEQSVIDLRLNFNVFSSLNMGSAWQRMIVLDIASGTEVMTRIIMDF